MERVRAERSVGPSLRLALGSLIGGQSPMPVAGWFYPSFANSFTLCLICLACAARFAFYCGRTIFLSLLLCVGWWGRWLWLQLRNHDGSFHCSMSAFPILPAMAE